jgi:hypothetical protein
MPEDKSQNGSIYGSIFDSDALSRETREILELGLAGSSFTPHTPQHSCRQQARALLTTLPVHGARCMVRR